jgi:hypothetical protein
MAPIPDRRSLLIAALVCVTGCSSTVPGQKKDGPAALIALRYCEHLLAGEWSAAQALTHPRSALSPQTLEQKAKALVKRWNLENAGAHISSVGERQGSSVVHLSLLGKRQGKQHRVTVSVVLLPDGEAWKVLPPS